MKTRLIATLAMLVAGTSLSAQTITLVPVADALLSSANPTGNYGGAGALAVSAAGLPKGEFDSLLRFDFAAAKSSFDALYGAGGWSIQAITLTLTATQPGNALFNGNAAGPGGTHVNSAGQFALRWMQNDAWVEGTGNPSVPAPTGVNFSALPGLLSAADEALGIFGFDGATTGSATLALTLTAGFSTDAAAGNLVSLLAQPADSGVAMLVNSRSVSTAAFRPTLTVVAVPEPGSAALAGAGVLVLGGVRRRARSAH